MVGGDRGSSDGAEAEAELRRGFNTLAVTRPDPSAAVNEVRLNRPAQRNALSPEALAEIPRAMALLDRAPSARAVVLSAAGPHFCAGIELDGPGSPLAAEDRGTAVELCRKPVIAVVHGACVGSGVDIMAACDLGYCSKDATFVVKEVDMAIVADLGSLQPRPQIVGYGNAANLAGEAVKRRLFSC